jgi:hypothetical protein
MTYKQPPVDALDGLRKKKSHELGGLAAVRGLGK